VLDARVIACSAPCLLELIWNYFMEEALVVQTISAITLRFQNKRGPGVIEPLASLALDPLRPMSMLLWGYIQGRIQPAGQSHAGPMSTAITMGWPSTVKRSRP
jgi:hypothetical protein